jgi:hypothetical protein
LEERSSRYLRMIFSENRYTLFRIMRWRKSGRTIEEATTRVDQLAATSFP